MSVMPPKVSFTHPADMVPVNRRASPYAPTNNTQISQPQPAVLPMQNPRTPSGGGLTFAQKLYASSMSTSLGPMINSHTIPHPPTSQHPPMHIRNLPTPPPSSSPPPGTGAPAHIPNTFLNGTGLTPNSLGSQSSYHSHQTMNRNFNSTPSSAPPFLNSHRANTFQTPILPSNSSRPQRHRAATIDQGISHHSFDVNPSTMASRPTRHLVTMARPPDQQSSSGLSPLALEPPAIVHPSAPPASSILFSQTTGTASASASALTPPLTTVQSTPVTSPNLSMPSVTAYRPQGSVSPLGRVAGSVGSLSDGVVSALQSVLLTPGTGIDQLSLQAVIQRRPDADYQKIINTLTRLHQHQLSLMKLQMQQPPPPAIDYQALIAVVQQAQEAATAQQKQQQLAQLHASAQLQVTQQQALQSPQGQQQQQTAAQQYQALVQQQYQQQAAIQKQQQQLQQVLTQQQQQQQAAQYQALQQQQQAQAQHNGFQHLNHHLSHAGGGGDNTGGVQAQSSFDPTSLYSTGGGGGGPGLFDTFSQSFGNPGGQDSGGFSEFSISFNQDNSGGFDMTYVDIPGQSN